IALLILVQISADTLLEEAVLTLQLTRDRDNVQINKGDFIQQHIDKRTLRDFFPAALRGLSNYDLCNVLLLRDFTDHLSDWALLIILNNKFFRAMLVRQLLPAFD